MKLATAAQQQQQQQILHHNLKFNANGTDFTLPTLFSVFIFYFSLGVLSFLLSVIW